MLARSLPSFACAVGISCDEVVPWGGHSTTRFAFSIWISLAHVMPYDMLCNHGVSPSCVKGIYDKHIRAALRFRSGVLYNNRLAHRYKFKDSDVCSLCPDRDSAVHLLLKCGHPRMRSMVIARHNQAVRAIAKAIANGKKGGCYMVMDAGPLDDVRNSVSTTIAGTRLPDWMLPHLTDKVRMKMRPDILIVPNIKNEVCFPDSDGDRAALGEVIILEIGYCNDTKYAEKLEQKMEQHAELRKHLKAAGWTDIWMVAMALGISGCVFIDLRHQLVDFAELLSHTEYDRLGYKLHRLALTWMYNIICTRRQLEHQEKTKPHGRASEEVT